MTPAQRTREGGADAAGPAAPADVPFEQALEELEELVRQLESGDLSLEAAVAAYERGTALLAGCSRRLSEVERRVEILSRRADGTCQPEPFAAEAAPVPDAAGADAGCGAGDEAADGPRVPGEELPF